MRNTYLHIISSQPLLPSVGSSFLIGMEFNMLISGVFFQKPQAGYGAEVNGSLGQEGESSRTGHLRVKHW